MRLAALACAALFVTIVLPQVAIAQESSASPYDLGRLHPDVRAAAVSARENAERAEAAATAARDAELRGRTAAERARNGEEGYRAYDFVEDQQQRRYEGEWTEGQRATGVGVLTFGAGPYTGDQYSGTFRRGRKFGPGVYVHASTNGGARYEGDYVDGEAERFGIYYGRDFRHAGRSCCDAFDGAAIYYFNNGERYEGEFANNRPNGYGVLWTSDGRVRRSGIWRNGHLRRRLEPNR